MKTCPRASARVPSSPRVALASLLLTAAMMAAVAGSAGAQRQFAELGKRHLPMDSDNTQAVAYGDVDGDGDLDLVIGNGYHQNRLYLNNGTGTFTDATVGRMPVDNDFTWSLALGDVDGDGDLDLVIGNGGFSAGQQNRLYLNNGTGTFTDATASRMPVDGDYTYSVALGDVDGDGDLDLVIGNSYAVFGQQNRLYLNNGRGTFTDATASRMPVDSDHTYSVVLGDVDGDGDLDLVIGNYLQRNRLYVNNGTGTFTDTTAIRMPVDNDYTRSVALGDVDGDGDLDLVTGNEWQNRLYLNNGTGTFADATASRMPVDGEYTYSVALGDVDADGDLDLVIGNYGQRNRLYLNNGRGTFTDATASRIQVEVEYTNSVALGDIDGDGDLDLVIGNAEQQNRMYLNNGTGTFSDATAGRMPVDDDATNSVALGDVDGDGDLDMVLGRDGQQNRLYLNNGTGTFTDATANRMPVDNDYTASLALGDVDGDGDLDLVLGNGGYSRMQQNRLYRNNGTGTFTVVSMPVANDYTTSVALGDVDGDGDLDLVIGNGGQQNRLYLNNGTGTFTDATASRMPVDNDTTLSVALGDVDGDGDLDMVLGNWSQQNRLYLNNGTGTFTDVTASRMPVDNDWTWPVALGDVDGDGDLDLVIANHGQSRLFVNNGAGTFTDVTASRMPVANHSTTSMAFGDVDRDGDLDLVLGNRSYTGQQNRLYVNNGTGTFTDATASRMPVADDMTNSVALGDVDGDGDLDLVIGNWFQQTLLYMNLLRQLDAPYVLRVGRSYQLDAYSRYGSATTTEIAFPFLSTGTANIPLPPFGRIGIDLTQMIVLPPFVIPQPAGFGSLTIAVPNQRSLGGVVFYTQAALDQQPVQTRLTNVVGDVALR